MLQLAEIGRLGAYDAPGIPGAQARQRERLRLCEIELLQIRPDHRIRSELLATEDGVPVRAVGCDLYRPARTDRQYDALPDVRLQRGEQCVVHHDIRDAEIARQQLHMRQ